MIRATPQIDKSKPVEKEQYIDQLVSTIRTAQVEMIPQPYIDTESLSTIRERLTDTATELHGADNNSRDSE